MKTRFSLTSCGLALWTAILVAFFALVGGAKAQVSVTVGSQVTDVSSIVSGKGYLIKYTSMTGTPYIYDAGTATPLQAPSSQNSPTTACVFYFVSVGNGAYKIENAYTGNYWPAPTGNARLYPTTAANAGSWSISISSGNATLTCTNGGTTYGLDRLTPDVVGWSSRKTVQIFEVSSTNLATSASYTELSGKDIEVSSTEASSISEGQWYVMKNRGRNGYAYEDNGSMKNQGSVPSGSATTNASYLVRFLDAGDGLYYLQNGLSNYWGAVPQNTAVPATTFGTEKYTVGTINSTAGHFYFTSETNNIVLDCQENGSPVVGWGTTIPTSTGGNNDWAIYPVTLNVSWTPTASEVYTITNTSNRGSLTYDPAVSSHYVWSSGKGGATAFDATSANCQWVLYPTGTSDQYYLYNVGAGMFAVPSSNASGANNAWYFSKSAVAVVLVSASGGYKIKAASDPVSGTNAAYVSVSNGQTNPIINYDDAGSIFAITQVTGDQSSAATSAVNKLVKNASTALTTYPQTSGWYVVQVKSASGNTASVGRYLTPASSLYSELYPMTYTGSVDVQPSVSDPTYFTYLDYRAWDDNDWQLPDGRYLVGNGSNKFPTLSNTASAIIAGYQGGNYFKSSSGYFADPYVSNGNYFVGETSTFRTTWNVYPVNLTTAGLVDWKVLVTSDGSTPVYDKAVSCTRSDVAGLASVYTGGHFFLPTGVTPTSSDFSLSGAISINVDGTNHIITANFDPNIAILDSDVTVAQGFQTAGRNNDVYLLRVTAHPFNSATGASLTVNLKDGTENQISGLTLYEADSESPEVLGTGSGTPTLTSLATASIDGSSSTVTLSIGNLSSGTHYYWLSAAVKSNATLGAVLDAAVTGLTYTCNNTQTTLDLTSVGDPSDRGAMVFNKRTYPFLPRDNGSRVYRIPGMIVADDGSIVVACDKRYASHTDIGGGHVIDIVIRRSTDGGATWSSPMVIAKGDNSNDATCGYGDPSLYKDKNGKLYCIYAAGNTGYFYGLSRVCVSVSTDNGATWNTTNTSPTDLTAQGKLTDHASSYGSNTCYGLYDYFVTSGRGLCTSEGYLMALLPAQAYTNSGKTEHTSNSHDYIFYSTDQGATWHVSENAIFTGGDEAKIIQANDGSLIASVRQSYNRGFNTATYSLNNDGTLSFTMGTQWNNNQLSAGGYANNQDIYYYQRSTVTNKTDVIFHSMTTGQHANFKLYYSTDGGSNWTEFLNVQTKGTRYVTMERGGTEENPGSLYLFFEDQSLNSAGGYTDYNHYPLNFIEITREQLESLIPTLNDELEVNPVEGVKVVYGTTGHTTYGTLSGLTWTSKVTSGLATGDNTIAGMTLVASDGAFNQFSSWNSHYNLAYHPSTANTDATLTLTAPAGYAIDSYSMLVAKASSATHTYTVTNAAGTSVEVPFGSSASSYATVSQSDINATSTVITVNTSDVGKWLAIADFVVNLKRAVTYNLVDESGTVIASQVVCFTSDNVENEMPDALKGLGYTYTYYSDAACTTEATSIGSLANIYVKGTAPSVTIRDNRQNRYIYAETDGFVRTSRVITYDNLNNVTWTLEHRGNGQYDLVNADGKYIDPASVSATDMGSSQNYYKVSTTKPAGYWTLTASTSQTGAYTILSSVDNATMHVLNYNDKYGVVRYGSAGNTEAGCQMFLEELPELPVVSDATNTVYYTIQSARSGHEAFAQNAVGDDFAGVAVATTDINQQWKITANSNGGYNLVTAGFIQHLNGDDVAASGYYKLTDAEPAAGWTIGYIYNGTYIITNGSKQVHMGGVNDSYKLMNWGSGTRYDDNCNFTIAEAPTPVEQLTSGWYQIKYHKNPADGAITANGHAGRYLYNDEEWTSLTHNGSRTTGTTSQYVSDADYVGFFPIRVDATASEPEADDATYYIWIDKDADNNFQLMSSNGHWVGNCGMANNDTPMVSDISGYSSANATTNMLKSFDRFGYNFGVKYGGMDAYLDVYDTTDGATAGKVLTETEFISTNTEVNAAVNRVWATKISDEYAANRYLVRPVNVSGVGLTAYPVGEASYPVGSDKYTNFVTHTYQHWAARITVKDGALTVSGPTTIYRGGTLFVKNNETVATDDFVGGSLSNWWHDTGHVREVAGVTSSTIVIVDVHVYETVERGVTASEGVGVGYPKDDHYARTGLAAIDLTKDWEAFTDQELLYIAMYADALLQESDITNLNMPVPGHSYSFKLMKSDGTSPKYLRYNQLNADRTEASSGIELADVPASGEIPEDGWFIGKQLADGRYVFVGISGKYVAYANSSGQGVYTDGVSETYSENGYIDISKFPYTGTNINTTDMAMYGKVVLKGYRTTGGASNTGTFIVNESTLAFDKSENPFFNGSFTSAFIVDEHKFINQDVKVNAGGDDYYYTTLYLPFSVELPDGATASSGILNDQTAKIDMTAIEEEDGAECTVIPKNTPVVIKFSSNPAGGKYTFIPALTPGIEPSENDLLGTLVNIPVVANAYTFAKGNTSGKVGFYKYTGSTLKEGKAYLIYNNSGNMPGFTLNFEGSATGIEGIETQSQSAGKQFFDLQGRRVVQPQKGGVYILNGQKVLVK